MKFKVGDQIIVTAGKDKGKTAKVLRVLPKLNRVVVQGINVYTRSIKPAMGRSGERVRKERPLDTAKIAIFNPDTKQADRIGYVQQDDKKVRVYRKTGKTI